MVLDIARPVYIPSTDFFQAPYGSGFVQDPAAVKKKMVDYGAKFCFLEDVSPNQACSSEFLRSSKESPRLTRVSGSRSPVASPI